MPRKPPSRKPAAQQSRQEQRRAYDRQRNQQPWRRWYWTARWRAKAKAQLAAEPLCAICLKAGRVTAATVADHIAPHRGDYDLFWDGPLQSLCDEYPWRCHSSVKQREERGAAPVGNDIEGRPTDPNHPWNRG